MSTEKIRECSKCGWKGQEAKWSYCPFCNSTYYKCPVCGGSTAPVKPPYTSIYSSSR